MDVLRELWWGAVSWNKMELRRIEDNACLREESAGALEQPCIKIHRSKGKWDASSGYIVSPSEQG